MAEYPGSDALDEARTACHSGDFARALDRYVWFFDNCLANDPAYYGVRLSYVLDEWTDLGKKYPPAAERFNPSSGSHWRRWKKRHLLDCSTT
jgi:hypothetical protein